MRLSFDELCELWIYAGGPAGWAPLMAGIALAESGGTPTAVQPDQPPATTGWGLWQITPGTRALLSPPANARAAVAKYNDALRDEDTGLRPWFDDRTWTAWQAAGAPAEPSEAQVRLYLAQWGYVLPETPALPEELTNMSVCVAQTAEGTIVAVDGVTTAGHKVVFTVPFASRANAKAWSIVDLSAAATEQGVTGTTFVS